MLGALSMIYRYHFSNIFTILRILYHIVLHTARHAVLRCTSYTGVGLLVQHVQFAGVQAPAAAAKQQLRPGIPGTHGGRRPVEEAR